MSQSDLKMLLRIRELRENKKQAEMRDSKRKLVNAHAAADQAREEMDAQHRDKIARERTLSKSVIGKTIKPIELEWHRLEIERMSEQTNSMRVEVSRCESLVKESVEDLSTARENWLDANRKVEGLSQLVDNETNRHRQSAEILLEEEAQDMPTDSRGRKLREITGS